MLGSGIVITDHHCRGTLAIDIGETHLTDLSPGRGQGNTYRVGKLIATLIEINSRVIIMAINQIWQAIAIQVGNK